MKPQIIDRYVYVKGKKISEATPKSNLDGNEVLPLAYNDVNYNTTVDQISEYVDKVHDYLTTENYNDLKGQIDSERTNRQEADSELNQSIQDTKSELHSTISGVESELLGEVNDLQEQIDSINETGIAKGVTLDTAQTITGEKTFATVPKSTADATEDTDLVNKKYVDDAVQDVDVDLSGYATEAWVNEQGFARTSDIPEGLEIGETTGTAFDGGRGKAVEDTLDALNTDLGLMVMHGAQWSQEQGDLQLNLDQAYRDGVSKDFTDRYIPIIVPTATSEYAGAMSAADKQKLDSIPTLTTSGDGTKYLSDNGTYKTIEIPDLSNYLTEDDKTELETEIGDLSENVNAQVTALQKKDSTIEGNVTNLTETVSGLDNKYLPLTGGVLEGDLRRVVYATGATDNLYTVLGKYSDDDLTTDRTSFIGQSTYPYGNAGQKLGLAFDQSTYKIYKVNDENDDAKLSELIDSTNYKTVIGDTYATTESIEGKYLPLSGGGLTGDLTIQSANARINISDTTLPSRTATMYVTENGATLSNTKGDSAGSELILNDYYIKFHKKSGEDYFNILHEGNISGSKVTTNSISGGLNITSITQSAYDGLNSKSPNTLYIITE